LITNVRASNAISANATFNYKLPMNGIAINVNTNNIYAPNPFYRKVTVIDGQTNNPSVRIKLTIDAPTSGYIKCNGGKLLGNAYLTYDLGTNLVTCEAKANSIFPPPFSYWSIIPPIWFDSWSGDLDNPDQNRDHTIKFEPTQFGTLTANFNVLSDTYASTFVSIAITAIAIPLSVTLYKNRDWIYKFKRQYYVDKYMKIINDLYEVSHSNKEECWKNLGVIRNRITELFINGDINQSNYTILNDRISEYMDKIQRL
jgi:hypothetical protein